MTTKRKAAVQFAASYGVWDGLRGTYTLSNYYRPSSPKPSQSLESLLTEQRNRARVERDRARVEHYKAREHHSEDLRLVMSLLGVEDQYKDTVETKEFYLGPYMGYRTSEVVTQTAVQKFAADLRAAQSALDGAAALKRLRKAIKTVKKESDK